LSGCGVVGNARALGAVGREALKDQPAQHTELSAEAPDYPAMCSRDPGLQAGSPRMAPAPRASRIGSHEAWSWLTSLLPTAWVSALPCDDRRRPHRPDSRRKPGTAASRGDRCTPWAAHGPTSRPSLLGAILLKPRAIGAAPDEAPKHRGDLALLLGLARSPRSCARSPRSCARSPRSCARSPRSCDRRNVGGCADKELDVRAHPPGGPRLDPITRCSRSGSCDAKGAARSAAAGGTGSRPG
jgi:hypothetical protein